MTLKHADLIHQGRIIRLERHTVEFPDGSAGQLDVVRHPGASAVVPFLDDPRSADPRILLIRHFRHAAGGWLWEIPAGRLDAGTDRAQHFGVYGALRPPLEADCALVRGSPGSGR